MVKNYYNLNCCYRDWRQAPGAKSHLHGYCLTVNVGCENEDGLDEFETWLREWFDHTVLVAHDDPFGALFAGLPNTTARVKNVDVVGCDAWAKMIYTKAHELNPSVEFVEVIEAGANTATYSDEFKGSEG